MDSTRFGPYMLLERVSVGGMAEVFRARRLADGESGKLLAIKRILPSMIEDDTFRKMFADEATISGQLVHRNIARIYENGTADSYPYIAMEYVWGKDLLQIQNRFRKLRQKMAPAMACHITIKLCEALDYAHRRTDAAGKPMLIVHRDCTPQNVIVSYKGEVKLVDFGIAKAVERLTMTAAGDVKGKLSYMAPEQIQGLPLDRRVDVYGAGVVLFELLLGDRLISANTQAELIQKARAGILPRPREVLPELAPALEEIILTAVARDPAKRYGWCSELRNALVAFMSANGLHFDGDDLTVWMKGAFALEMMKEAEALDTLPTFEGLVSASEFDESTVADPAALGRLGALAKVGAMPPRTSPASASPPPRRMASTISRAELIARSGAISIPPHVEGGPVAPSPTKVLPRLSDPPPLASAVSGDAAAVAPAVSDDLEETYAHIPMVIADADEGVATAFHHEAAMPSHSGPLANGMVQPVPSETSMTSVAPTPAKAAVAVVPSPRRSIALGIAIGVAAATVLATVAYVLFLG